MYLLNTERTMLMKWMKFHWCEPHLWSSMKWWLFKGFKALRCFWTSIFILSQWKLHKGYQEEALWILLTRRLRRLIFKPVVTKYILQPSSGWRRDPKTFPGDIFLCRCSDRADWKEEDYFSAFLSSINNPISSFSSLPTPWRKQWQ